MSKKEQRNLIKEIMKLDEESGMYNENMMKNTAIKCVLCGGVFGSFVDEEVENGVCHGCEQEMTVDPIVKSVVNDYYQRSKVGRKKYGTTLAMNKLNFLEWLQHLQEELMDATLYIERLKKEDLKEQKVTRVELIDVTGRVYSKWDCQVELHYQDNGKTLKIFVHETQK